MQTNILWTGREYYSLENCILTTTNTGSEVNSVIVGMYLNKIYRVEYLIILNEKWEPSFFELKYQGDDRREVHRYHSDGGGNWFKDKTPIHEFIGCTDIDIPLTPLTNTLAINRTKLSINESQEIKVLYMDILNHEIKPLRQRYTRLSETTYKYENVPNDFEAIVCVDELGLVVDYPELFVRTVRQESHFSHGTHGK